MTTIPVYSVGVGINNKIPPHRLPFNDGVAGLEAATDVIVNASGEISSRRGYSEEIAGDYHSLFPGTDWGLVALDRANDTAIYQVVVSENGEVSLNGIRSSLTKGAKFDFCRVQEAIFYTNGFEHGMVVDGSSVPWKESEWEDEDTTTGFAAPPAGNHLGYNAGRIYFSVNDVLYYTEFGRLGLYDPATDGEHFPSKILAIAPAADGMYVSDQESIYFLSGLNPHEWTSRRVTSYPAKEWGKFHLPVDPSFFGFDTNIPSSMLATKSGPVLLMPSGQGINLIDKNITMPDCPDVGAIGVFDETLIIQTGE